jgi:4-methyl-5(b-hydroxyethyl)-thiazole monophosphate biosynthesis
MSARIVLVPLLEGFEEIEAVTIVDVLRRAELTVATAGERRGPVRGAHGIEVVAERALGEIDTRELQAIVLPGGMPGSARLAEHPIIQGILRDLHASGHHIGAICAAPIALASAGVHRGKKLTCYPGFEERLQGATIVDERVVVDGKLVTSRGPGTAIEFALTLVRLLTGPATAQTLAERLLVPPLQS